MAEVFLCKTGMLTAASKRELKKAGVVVVEVEDPAACQFIRASALANLAWCDFATFGPDRGYRCHLSRSGKSRDPGFTTRFQTGAAR